MRKVACALAGLVAIHPPNKPLGVAVACRMSAYLRLEPGRTCSNERRAGSKHVQLAGALCSKSGNSHVCRTLNLTVLLPLLVSVMVWLALVSKLFSNRTTDASVAGAIATVGSAVRSSCQCHSASSVHLQALFSAVSLESCQQPCGVLQRDSMDEIQHAVLKPRRRHIERHRSGSTACMALCFQPAAAG